MYQVTSNLLPGDASSTQVQQEYDRLVLSKLSTLSQRQLSNLYHSIKEQHVRYPKMLEQSHKGLSAATIHILYENTIGLIANAYQSSNNLIAVGADQSLDKAIHYASVRMQMDEVVKSFKGNFDSARLLHSLNSMKFAVDRIYADQGLNVVEMGDKFYELLRSEIKNLPTAEQEKLYKGIYDKQFMNLVIGVEVQGFSPETMPNPNGYDDVIVVGLNNMVHDELLNLVSGVINAKATNNNRNHTQQTEEQLRSLHNDRYVRYQESARPELSRTQAASVQMIYGELMKKNVFAQYLSQIEEVEARRAAAETMLRPTSSSEFAVSYPTAYADKSVINGASLLEALARLSMTPSPSSSPSPQLQPEPPLPIAPTPTPFSTPRNVEQQRQQYRQVPPPPLPNGVTHAI